MEHTPILKRNAPIPLFSLPDKHGEVQNLAKRRGRQHLFVLVCGPDVNAREYLEALAAEHDEWTTIPAAGIVVVDDADAAGALGALPFTILVDEGSRVRDRFLPPGTIAGAFVADRYFSLYEQWLAVQLADLPAASEITDWLRAIGMQCSL